MKPPLDPPPMMTPPSEQVKSGKRGQNSGDFWRPVTAIKRGDEDGNPETVPDPSFEPFMPTPPVQDCPSTHSVLGAAAAEVRTRYFGARGDETGFGMTSSTASDPEEVRSLSSFAEAAEENADSRVVAGIHFRFACDAGLALGKDVGAYVFEHFLQRDWTVRLAAFQPPRQRLLQARRSGLGYPPGLAMIGSGAQETLQIRLLGEQEVFASGRRLPLPPSKKTRALLGYLVMSGRSHRRERLCDLLWDVADDRRAALRWSLSKLREIVDAPGVTRLRADRDHVSIDLRGASVDVFEVRRLLGEAPEEAPTAALQAARAWFRGELLEGLDLPDFHAYYAWCVAERKVWRDCHRRVLSTLLARTSGHPDKALPLARELVDLDPLDESARAKLLELLHAAGKIREAEERSRASRRLLQPGGSGWGEQEGSPAAAALSAPQEQGGREGDAACCGGSPVPVPPVSGTLEAARPRESRVPFVGRSAERARIAAWLDREPSGLRIVLIQGEAGAGKTRFMREITGAAEAAGARVLIATVPEVRAGWPYAPWLEILSALISEHTEASVRAQLGPLFAGASARAEPQGGREQLFRAAAACIAQCAPISGRLMIALDDVHWLDDASAELLYFVAHAARTARVAILLTARGGELFDQPNVARALRVLRREGLLEQVELPLLTRAETLALIDGIAHPELADTVYEQSAGNPLFALELARATKSGGMSLSQSISELVRDRLDALAPELAELLRWAAVLGSRFDPGLLGELASASPEALVEGLEQLERHHWLALTAAAPNAKEACAFSHDIVRSAVYDQLSDPRRRLMHARVAKLLSARSPGAPALAPAVAHHAALGGDCAMAARACLAAGRRSLSLFAHGDAAALARRGLAYAQELADPERTSLSLELFEVSVYARRPDAPEELSSELVALTTHALDLGDMAHARLGFHLRSVLMWREGRHVDAERYSREAERICRLGGPRERVLGLAEAARCLAYLQRDLHDAEALLLEAEALAGPQSDHTPVLPLARGLLLLHRGELDRAAGQLDRARELARRTGERLEEFCALEYRIDLEFRRARYDIARGYCEELVRLGDRLPPGSEGPFAHALLALSAVAAGIDTDFAAFEATLPALAAADAKQRQALLYVRAAQVARSREDEPRCVRYAARARQLAELMDRVSELTLALALSVEVAPTDGGGAQAEDLKTLEASLERSLSAEARAAAEGALRARRREESRKERGDGTRHRRARVR